MRKVALVTALTLAMAASPALAQGQSGGAPGGGPPAGVGGPGGGPGGGMGAGPPMTPPGQTGDPSAAARDLADLRGQHGRDFAEQRRMDNIERAELRPERLDDFVSRSADRRAEAFALRDAARAGQPVGKSSKELRRELRRDMEAWREAFRVDRKAWQDLRDQLLVDEDDLTPEQWAARRAEWFEARDAWIARQREWAQSRGNNDTDSGG